MRAPERETPAGGAGVGGGVISQTRDDSLDDTEAARKLQATLTARLALHGVELHALAGGGFIAVGAGSVAHLGDLGAVQRYAAMREGRS
jgi:hypothetical protein